MITYPEPGGAGAAPRRFSCGGTPEAQPSRPRCGALLRSDLPGQQSDVGPPCPGSEFKHSEAFSFQVTRDTQEETDRYWNAIVDNGGMKSACCWCKDRWGFSWQITPRALTDALAGADRAPNRNIAKVDVVA